MGVRVYKSPPDYINLIFYVIHGSRGNKLT